VTILTDSTVLIVHCITSCQITRWTSLPQCQCGSPRHLDGLPRPRPPKSNLVIGWLVGILTFPSFSIKIK